MKLLCDLHIHTSLSPCADEDMTPGNIVGMARSVGLQVIAITDHQSCSNCAAVIAQAERVGGPLVLPGLEVESQEEVHLICLLPDLASAADLAARIRGSLPAIANRPEIFGRQVLVDENDVESGTENVLLLQACRLGCDEIAALTLARGGVCIPAHIDRDANSMLTVLGRIPADFPARTLEISARADAAALLDLHPELAGFSLIRGSDAHRLTDLAQAGWPLEIPAFATALEGRQNIIRALRQGL